MPVCADILDGWPRQGPHGERPPSVNQGKGRGITKPPLKKRRKR
jgi:hypothetical protein